MEYYTLALTINTETESSYKRHRSPREIHWAEMETKMLEQLGWSGPKIECDLFLFKIWANCTEYYDEILLLKTWILFAG